MCMFVDSAPKTDDENTESRDVIPASRFMAQRFVGVGVPGCGNEQAVLNGPSGWVRFNEAPFETHMTCGWNIRVSENKQVRLHFVRSMLGADDYIEMTTSR
ncbi:hypothetical protein NP493_919g02002 [Ridgeia piscesae]|uniref:CUB domain-containing protein n=1 Tax=Ridgeia piscesae TaxID=27915 RepID=A0AAD9NMU9_RIDPI|nr:hypothetical protein NP493_919g02002 [Ridgeia piscesae]